MSLISMPNPNSVSRVYNQEITANVNVSITFMMHDSSSSAGQDQAGMALPGKYILANYVFQSPIGATQSTTSPQILVEGRNIQILPSDVYGENKANELWQKYIAPHSNRGVIKSPT